MRAVILALCVVFTGCASQPPFEPQLGIPEFRAWCRVALSNPTSADHKQFASAYNGDTAALRAFFQKAYDFEMSTSLRSSEEEFLDWTMETLLHRLGDNRFSDALMAEVPRTRSAVRHFLKPSSRFPKTEAILNAAPAIDFPLEKAYRRS